MPRYAAPTGNLSTTADLFIQVNSWTNNFFFAGMLFAIFFIMWIRLSFTTTVGRALTASAFSCMIVSILLRMSNVLSTEYMVTFIILTGVGMVWSYVENTRGSI